MKKVLLLSIMTVLFVFSVAFAAGNVEKGKASFNDPKFAGGTAGKSCNSCHDTKWLEKVAGKTEGFKIMGKSVSTLEEAVNTCVEGPLKGKAIDAKGADMADVVAYIRSFKK